MLHSLRKIILVLIAIGIIFPFIALLLGIGGQDFVEAGWIIPMILLYLGIPVVLILSGLIWINDKFFVKKDNLQE